MTLVIHKGDNQHDNLLDNLKELTPVKIDENTTLNIPCDQPQGPSTVYSQTTKSKPTSPLSAVKLSTTLDPTCSPFTPADHHNSYNNFYSINEFSNLPCIADTASTTARTTMIVPSNAGMTSLLFQRNRLDPMVRIQLIIPRAPMLCVQVYNLVNDRLGVPVEVPVGQIMLPIVIVLGQMPPIGKITNNIHVVFILKVHQLYLQPTERLFR